MPNHNTYAVLDERPNEVLDQGSSGHIEAISPTPKPNTEASLAQTALNEVEAEKKTSQVKVTIGGQEVVGDSYNEIANKLIDTGPSALLIENLDKLTGLDHNEIANKLIDAGKSDLLIKNLDKLTGLDYNEIANKLIDAGKSDSLIRSLDKFTGLDMSIANKLANDGYYPAYHLGSFTGLDMSIANKLIDAGDGYYLIHHLDSFTGLDHNEIANKLIDAGESNSLIRNLDKFTGLDHSEIANKIIGTVRVDSAKNLDSRWITNKIIDTGPSALLIKNLDKFPGLDHSEIANKLIDVGRGKSVVQNLDSFTGLDHSEIANKLIDVGRVDLLIEYLYRFTGLNVSTANKLIDTGRIDSLIENLNRFTGLDMSTANKLIDAGESYLLAQNLDNFTGIDDMYAALKDIGRLDILIDSDNRDNENLQNVDFADNSYVYLKGGFSREAIGKLIRQRLDRGIESNIHDASQWLSEFQMPKKWADAEAIKADRADTDKDVESYYVSLKKSGVEARFILQLLEAGSGLRKRLIYGNTYEPSDQDKLKVVFESYPDLQRELNTRIGRGRAELTNNYYGELLKDPDINVLWQEFQSNGGESQRKFFKEYFTAHESEAVELESRAIELQIQIQRDLLEESLDKYPEIREKINSQITQSGEDWFYYPEYQLLYKAACSPEGDSQLYKKDDFSIDDLFGRAHAMIDSYYEDSFNTSKDKTSHRLTKEKLTAKLNRAFERLTDNKEEIMNQEDEDDLEDKEIGDKKLVGLSNTVMKLKKMRHNRERYIRDTQTWLARHALAPSRSLTKVWGDRSEALAHGTADSIPAIQAWQRVAGFNKRIDRLEQTGKLQEMGLDREYIGNHTSDISELTRQLSGKNAVRALGKMKRWAEKRDWTDKVLPAASTEVGVDGSRYSLDIFGADDPRGFTIGEDTACCMTINGVSKSCIKAGYTRENAGFLGVYMSNGDLLAQSFWYVHPKDPTVLVLDNVEANEGRNPDKILKIYEKALRSYLTDHPDVNITEVRIGTGYSDVNLGDLPRVKNPRTLDYSVYTDAYKQVHLMTVDSKRANAV